MAVTIHIGLYTYAFVKYSGVNRLAEEEKSSDYELIKEGDESILKIDYEINLNIPSIEDDSTCMARTIERLIETGPVGKIVFLQKRDYEYDYSQTQLLVEIAQLYKSLVKEGYLHYFQTLLSDSYSARVMGASLAKFQEVFYRTFKSDPAGAYIEIRRLSRQEKIRLKGVSDQRLISEYNKFIKLLDYIGDALEKTQMIQALSPFLAGFTPGDRRIYNNIFTPTTKPDFMYTRLMSTYPSNGEEVDSYNVGESEVTIFKFPDSVKNLYHIFPPEFKLSEEKYEILDIARNILAEYKPSKEEFINPERMRDVFYKVGLDLVEELSTSKNYGFTQDEIKEIVDILVRYTVGFGLIEVLLADEKIQDISVNSPMGQTPIFIVHQDFGDCYTNIYPTKTESESWATKLRLMSGRPLDEANPILDTEVSLSVASTRVSVITSPLNPTGLAYSFRRHRDEPWTLPLFIKAGMIDPLAAGLISFLVDGTRTILVCGTRSSGKTSFLGSLLVEIMRRYRIITIEDTLELPSKQLIKEGYNLQQMKVAGALAKEGSAEVTATDGIRATLRLGDSALFVGEVRSQEAIALYEAMRVGAAANVVAGTIHAESPYGVFDRVVNDIGVPRTSFKATDLIIVANPIRSASGTRRVRRITQITEVRKHWENDPMLEGGFVDLMKYDVESDRLLPSQDLINGDSEILKAVAGNIRGLAGNWDAVWDNITLRAKIKQTLVEYSDNLKDLALLEAHFVILANDMFHNIVEEVQNEVGGLDSGRIFFEWEEWLKREVKKRDIKTNK
ncbi:type II/IV secretion system ATPase subunit [Candidatus Woesearchaeota archaeon]|nr:type II/IV secretion system ATPase subunit [Candidatus Woesearchaeota archaeon]